MPTRSILLIALGLLGLLLITACPTGRDRGGEDDDDAADDDDDDSNPYAVCQDYLACAGEMAPTEMADLLEAYGPDGSCWSQGNEVAETCGAACEAGLDELRDLPDAHACWPDACADFAVEYRSECSYVAQETWCGDDWTDWRECVEPLLDGCDYDVFVAACEDDVPIPDGAIYRPGTWDASWSSTDLCEELDGTDIDIWPETLALSGDSITTLEVDIWSEFTALSFLGMNVECSMDGDEFLCVADEEPWTSEGRVVQTLAGRFTSLETAEASFDFLMEGEDDGEPVNCEAEASGTLSY